MNPTGNFLLLTLSSVLIFIIIGNETKRICGPNQFRCKHGRRCVSALNVCDGINHCKDSMEENREFCTGNFTGLTKTVANECRAGMYRCRFGGCVNATVICDGHPDCYDSSDETKDLCGKNRCSPKQFRCDYGACVRNKVACNGRRDCLDGSDETREFCYGKVCTPEEHFKCNYGACIPKDKACDFHFNCIDHSDEDPELCHQSSKTSKTIKTSKPSKTSKNNKTTKPKVQNFKQSERQAQNDNEKSAHANAKANQNSYSKLNTI